MKKSKRYSKISKINHLKWGGRHWHFLYIFSTCYFLMASQRPLHAWSLPNFSGFIKDLASNESETNTGTSNATASATSNPKGTGTSNTGDPILSPLCNQLISSGKNIKILKNDPLPLVDWLNETHVGAFFQPLMQSILNSEKYFNDIDSLGIYNLSLQPFTLYSNFNFDDHRFKLQTTGVTLTAGVAVNDRWIIGGGIGYWHSSLDWKKSDTNANSVGFGPYASYLFDKGYINFTLLGVWNSFDVDRHFIINNGETKTENDHISWDIVASLEGGYDFEAPKSFGTDFFIQPNINLNYLKVFQNKYDEKLKEKNADEGDGEQNSATIESRQSDFLRSRIAVQFWKEFFKKDKGFLIPSLSVGWILMQPLSNREVSLSCKNLHTDSYDNSNQLYLDLKLTGIHKRGVSASLEFEANIGNPYSVYLGNIRIEWSW